MLQADPKSSRVYDGLVQAVEYTLADPVMVRGKGKAAVFVISDMIDNTPDNAARRARAVNALTQVGKRGGVVALFFVDVQLCAPWGQLLRDAGMPEASLCIQADIVGQPRLPIFD
jgi:hypothetical protein